MIGVLFAGGRGTRLGVETSKGMVEVGGRPLYTYGVDALVALGVPANRIMPVVSSDGNDLDGDLWNRYGGRGNVAAPTILGSLASLIPDDGMGFREDVAMVFGDEVYGDLESVRAFRSVWDRRLYDAILFFVRGEDTARKTYTVFGSTDFTWRPSSIRVSRLIEKPTWVPRLEHFGRVAGTGLAIARPGVVNAAVDVRDRVNWIDLFQLAVDRGLSVLAVPFDAPYFNVNTRADLDELKGWIAGR